MDVKKLYDHELTKQFDTLLSLLRDGVRTGEPAYMKGVRASQLREVRDEMRRRGISPELAALQAERMALGNRLEAHYDGAGEFATEQALDAAYARYTNLGEQIKAMKAAK